MNICDKKIPKKRKIKPRIFVRKMFKNGRKSCPS